jgi:hypothetical protein
MQLHMRTAGMGVEGAVSIGNKGLEEVISLLNLGS